MYNIEILKNFLNFEEEFWEYVKDRTTIIPETYDDPLTLCAVFIKTNELDEVTNMKILVPKMNNEKNILINIHEFTHAHDLYLILGKKMNFSTEEYEQRAKQKEKEYKKRHL